MESISHQTLGCECDSPKPKSPGSALCAECGLIHLTAEQYDEHLARCRAEVAALFEPKVAEQPQEAPADREPRGWLRRRLSRAAAPAA